MRSLKTLTLRQLVQKFLPRSVPVDGETWQWERLAAEIKRRVNPKQKRRSS